MVRLRADEWRHLVHVALELLVVLEHVLLLLLGATVLGGHAFNILLAHPLVDVAVVLVQVLKLLAGQPLRVLQAPRLVVHLPPATGVGILGYCHFSVEGAARRFVKEWKWIYASRMVESQMIDGRGGCCW